MKYILLNLLITFVLVGCGDDSPKMNTVTFNKVESIHKIFNKKQKLPSEILEFNFVQYNIISSSRLPGPADYTSYLRIKVKIADIEKWVSNLKSPFNNTTIQPSILLHTHLKHGGFQKASEKSGNSSI